MALIHPISRRVDAKQRTERRCWSGYVESEVDGVGSAERCVVRQSLEADHRVLRTHIGNNQYYIMIYARDNQYCINNIYMQDLHIYMHIRKKTKIIDNLYFIQKCIYIHSIDTHNCTDSIFYDIHTETLHKCMCMCASVF